MSPAQLAKDVATLQKVLSEFPQYYSAFIVGPEAVHALEEYFQGLVAVFAYNNTLCGYRFKGMNSGMIKSLDNYSASKKV